MPRRPAATLVLITRHELVRADFGPGTAPALLNIWTQPRSELPDLPSLVEAALLQAPNPTGRDLWVLSSDLWVQTMPLPPVRTTGMSEADLANALNFEAEALSGQSALESTVGCVTLGGDHAAKDFWLVQVRSSGRYASGRPAAVIGKRPECRRWLAARGIVGGGGSLLASRRE
jgi:hypothetical protein